MKLYEVKGTATGPSGQKYPCVVQIFGRDGSKSDTLWAIVIGGRRVMPFEARLRGWKLSLDTLLKAFYGPRKVSAIIYQRNPVLEMINNE